MQDRQWLLIYHWRIYDTSPLESKFKTIRQKKLQNVLNFDPITLLPGIFSKGKVLMGKKIIHKDNQCTNTYDGKKHM